MSITWRERTWNYHWLTRNLPWSSLDLRQQKIVKLPLRYTQYPLYYSICRRFRTIFYCLFLCSYRNITLLFQPNMKALQAPRYCVFQDVRFQRIITEKLKVATGHSYRHDSSSWHHYLKELSLNQHFVLGAASPTVVNRGTTTSGRHGNLVVATTDANELASTLN